MGDFIDALKIACNTPLDYVIVIGSNITPDDIAGLVSKVEAIEKKSVTHLFVHPKLKSKLGVKVTDRRFGIPQGEIWGADIHITDMVPKNTICAVDLESKICIQLVLKRTNLKDRFRKFWEEYLVELQNWFKAV